MSAFEFQRFVTIGQYLPTGSPIHQLDPRSKLIANSALLLAVAVTPSLTGLIVAIVIAGLLLVAARVPISYAVKGVLAPLPFILLLVAIQVLFGPGGDVQTWLAWGPVSISPSTIANGAKILLRFPSLILIITLSSATSTTTEVVRGLDGLLRPLARLGVPVQDGVLMVQVTLRFLPVLAREAERIAKSQASRGAAWGEGGGRRRSRGRRLGLRRLVERVGQALPLLVPLFLVSLRRAESLALAMEARGYYSQRARTSLISLSFGLRDVAALLVAAAASAGIVLL